MGNSKSVNCDYGECRQWPTSSPAHYLMLEADLITISMQKGLYPEVATCCTKDMREERLNKIQAVPSLT